MINYKKKYLKYKLKYLKFKGGMNTDYEDKTLLAVISKNFDDIYKEVGAKFSVMAGSEKLSKRYLSNLIQKMLTLIIKYDLDNFKNHYNLISYTSTDDYYKWAGGFDNFNSIIDTSGKVITSIYGNKLRVDVLIPIIHHAIHEVIPNLGQVIQDKNRNTTTKQIFEHLTKNLGERISDEIGNVTFKYSKQE